MGNMHRVHSVAGAGQATVCRCLSGRIWLPVLMLIAIFTTYSGLSARA